MRRLLMMALMALMALQMPARAQNDDADYKPLVAKVVSATGMDMSSLRGVFLTLAKQKDAARANELVDAYMGEPFNKCMVNVMTKYYKKHLTLSEMTSLAKEAETLEYKTMQAHNAELQRKTGEISQYSTMVMQQIFMGATELETVEITVPTEYAKAFKEFYEHSDIKGILTKTVNSLLTTVAQTSVDQNTINAIKKGVDHVIANMPNLMCNMSYGILTEEELKLGAKMTVKYHLDKVLSDYMENATQEGMAIMEDFSKWLETEGAK